MAVSFSVELATITIDLSGANRFFSLKSQLVIPVENIEYVEAVEDVVMKDYVKKFCMRLGTYFPKVVAEGTFYQDDTKSFLYVHEGKSAVLLKLKQGEYAEVLIEADNPSHIVEQIENITNKKSQ